MPGAFIHRFFTKIKRTNYVYFHINRYELALLILLSLVVFIWYGNGIVNTFDYDFPYDPEKALERSINIWDNYASYGSPNVRPVAGILPQSLFFAIGYSIGIPLVVLQRLIFFMILAGSGTSAYILFKIWDKDNAYPRGALFAAILYMFNPIASMFIWNQFTSSYYSYAFLPLIIAFLIIFIRSGSYKWLIIGVLSWTLLITPSYMNPVNAMIDWAVVGSFFLLSGMEKQKRLINIVKLFSILIVIWMMLNAYWIIPQSQYISSELVKANVEDIGISNFELFYSNSAPFSKAFLQTGYWGLYGEYKGDSWYSWGPFASSWIYIVALLVITVVSISEVASNHLRNKKIFLGTLILVCLVLINGVYSPFGGLFIDLFEKYPSLYMFRSAYQRFGPVLALAYSLLFGFACSGLLSKIRKPIRFRKPFQLRKEGKHIVKILVISAVITSLVTISIPYLNGDIILEGGEIVRSAWTEVPDYYFEANEWFTNQGEGYYILPLPYCKLYYAAYDWQQGYWGWEPSLWIFENKVISRELDDVNLIIVNVTEGILSGAPDFNPQKMMSLLNIRYILVHEDTNWNFIEGHEWWVRSDLVYEDYLECMNNIGFPMAVKIGDLTIFENPLWDGGNYRQVDTIISIVGGFSAVNNLTLEPWFDPNHMGIVQIDSENNFNQGFANNYLYNTDKIVNSSPLGLNSNIPDIKYVSNSKREGMVSGEYHYLIMYEKYDDQWSISTSNGPISHMKMNIFMNGWIIENGTSENQKVVFTYEAQKLFTIGFIISLSSLSILLIILYCLVFIKKQSVIRNSDFIEIEMEEIDEFK